MFDVWQGRCWSLCVIVALSVSCTSGAVAVANSAGGQRSVSYLDIANPAVVHAIEPADGVQEGSKFVQVEVIDVKNPKAYPASFTVEYLTKAHEKVFLGSFSLFPSDKPGKFIVSTQGKLRNEGAIVVSLVIPDGFKSEDVLSIGVGTITFLK